MTVSHTSRSAVVSRLLTIALLTILLTPSLVIAGLRSTADAPEPLGLKGLVLGMSKADVLAWGLTACTKSRVPFMTEECARPAGKSSVAIAGHDVDHVIVWLMDERVHGIGLFVTGDEDVFDHVRSAVASRYGSLSAPMSSIKEATHEVLAQGVFPGGWIGVRWTRWLKSTSSPTVFLLFKSPTFMALGARRDPEQTRRHQ
jgi:hypothetical protein